MHPILIEPLDKVLDRADELDRAEAKPGLAVLGVSLEDSVEGSLAPGKVARDQVLLGDVTILGGRCPSSGDSRRPMPMWRFMRGSLAYSAMR